MLRQGPIEPDFQWHLKLSTIHILPPELWTVLISMLKYHEIISLLITGNIRLLRTLGKGVLELEAETGFSGVYCPFSSELYPLFTSLKHINLNSRGYNLPFAHLDLEKLPPTLESISIDSSNCYHTLSAALRQLGAPAPWSRFEKLDSLNLCGSNLESSFFHLLPSRLTSLWIYDSGLEISTETISGALPTSLADLELGFKKLIDDNKALKTWLPPNLTRLGLTSLIAHSNWFKALPQTLLDLDVAFLRSDQFETEDIELPKLEKLSLQLVSKPNLCFPTSNLPDSLTDISLFFPLIGDTLPPRLKKCSGLGFLPVYPNLTSLPTSLTYIAHFTEGNGPFNLSTLPSTLLHIHVDTMSHTKLHGLSSLPKALLSLRLPVFDPQWAVLLPQTLTSLHWTAVNVNHVWDEVCVAALPSSLTSLGLRLGRIQDTEAWKHWRPTALTALKISIRNAKSGYGKWFSTCFPLIARNLIDLKVTFYGEYDQTVRSVWETVSFEKLRSLSILVSPPTIDIDLLSRHLPKTLTNLTIGEVRMLPKPNFFLALPEALTRLRLQIGYCQTEQRWTQLHSQAIPIGLRSLEIDGPIPWLKPTVKPFTSSLPKTLCNFTTNNLALDSSETLAPEPAGMEVRLPPPRELSSLTPLEVSSDNAIAL